MRARPLAAISAVMYFLSILAFFCLVGIDVFPNGVFPHLAKFIAAFLVFLCGYTASFFRCIQADNSETAQRIMKKTVIFLFAAYLLIVIDFTLIDNSFGRQVSNIFSCPPNVISDYFKNNINFIPFETVKLFFRGWIRGTVGFSVLSENIFGNLAVFMPFAFFIPMLSRNLRHPMKFFGLVSAVIIAIELFQVILLTGSADIDDYILNATGAVLAFLIFNFKPVSDFLKKLTFGAWES